MRGAREPGPPPRAAEVERPRRASVAPAPSARLGRIGRPRAGARWALAGRRGRI
ncbi:hypothetical protein HMPREF0682_0775 [Propionibacterium acidifaciens F0233]|uniref:Uncharacterized protein n=1 Tax=Propionibacterium acidifaciens F0233 TaxID=553198 RepID=U2QX75_9ACTN|nr:hypothetical protein HMPREF0682_0775 [Propionibacterium acidifaciens F0233]